MKYHFRKITLVLLCVLLLPLSSNAIEPTTAAEYNYGSVGYRIQKQAGMPDKDGYNISKVDEYEDDTRKVEMMGMFREGESSPCAVIMVYTRIRTAPLYFCMPTRDADQELWDKFSNSLTTGTDNPQEQLQFFAGCIARLGMKFAGQ